MLEALPAAETTMSETTTTPPKSPEGTPAAPTRKQTALMKRLARMKDHKDFEKAMAHTPPTEEALERATTKVRRGGIIALIGGVLAILNISRGIAWFPLILALAAAGFGIKLLLEGLAGRKDALKDPLVRRVALVADRRSETSLGWVEGRTIYFFQLEFDDGTNGEFRYPGRGVSDDLLVKGNTGVAFLRGQTLIAWKNIKV